MQNTTERKQKDGRRNSNMAKGDIPYSYAVMSRVRQQLGLDDENDTSKDSQIKIMSKSEIFDRCLKWEGIIGFDYQILSWINDIWKVELE
jgi:hypothetical protein